MRSQTKQLVIDQGISLLCDKDKIMNFVGLGDQGLTCYFSRCCSGNAQAAGDCPIAECRWSD